MLQVALVGAWHVHFNGYAKKVQEREDCQITALWDDDVERGTAAAEQFHCIFEPDYDKLLSRSNVDAIVVASATNQHPQLIQKAAEAGKHIFTEKVLCFTSDQALKLKEVIQRQKIQFCISFPWLCRSELQYAKQMIEEGTLGQITYARVRNAHNGASGNWLPAHFYDKEACGGGAMMDLGAHPMYLLSHLLGKPKAITSVFQRVTGKPVEDNAVSLLEFEHAIASSETGFVSVGDAFALQLSGTDGSLYWGPQSGITVNTKSGVTRPQTLPEPLKEPVDQWVDAILYGGEISSGIEEAVLLTQVMETAYLSYEQKRRVEMK